jgi:hypothetical protein
MRRFTTFAVLAAFFAAPVFADGDGLIGQLGSNQDATGERSSASLSQIGKRAVESGRLVDQIDASRPYRANIDESRVSEVLPSDIDSNECLLTTRQEAVFEYLREEGRVFRNNCEMLSWLDGNDVDEPSERDLFNVIFGPEAQRVKQAELERLEREQAELEARARILNAINNASSNDG